MNIFFISLFLLVEYSLNSLNLESQTVPLVNSFGHRNNALEKLGDLNPAMTLTLTLVTGSMENTQLVASYYQSIQGLTILERTDMHIKLSGSVEVISKAFETTFSEYQCGSSGQQTVCYASNSEVYVPASLNSAIIGILGLENILTMKSH